MAKYITLRCIDCNYEKVYAERFVDGRRCPKCNSVLYIPIEQSIVTGIDLSKEKDYTCMPACTARLIYEQFGIPENMINEMSDSDKYYEEWLKNNRIIINNRLDHKNTNDEEKLNLAWKELFNEIVKALRIERVVEWLNRKLGG